MSKILDLLNYNSKQIKKSEDKNFSSHISPQSFNSEIKEKLADTYIFKPIHASENADKKALPHKYTAAATRIGFVQLFPWLISFLAVLLLLVNIAYRGKINFKIEILNESAVQPITANVTNISPSQKDLSQEIENSEPPEASITLIGESYPNRHIVKRLGFYGAALNKSRLLDDGFFLYNDGTAGWASVGLDFLQPTDLSHSTLDFFVKGVDGNESLKLILRDAENNSYMPQAYNVIFDGNMGKDWQFVSIPLNNLNGTYNSRRVKHIGFEFGTQTISNQPGTSIYIKKIKLVKLTRTYEKELRIGR